MVFGLVQGTKGVRWGGQLFVAQYFPPIKQGRAILEIGIFTRFSRDVSMVMVVKQMHVLWLKKYIYCTSMK